MPARTLFFQIVKPSGSEKDAKSLKKVSFLAPPNHVHFYSESPQITWWEFDNQGKDTFFESGGHLGDPGGINGVKKSIIL